jgi:hypothetical protein
MPRNVGRSTMAGCAGRSRIDSDPYFAVSELNSSGCLLTCDTSSPRTTAQNPRSPCTSGGSSGVSSGGCQLTGLFSRNLRNVSSRSTNERDQKRTLDMSSFVVNVRSSVDAVTLAPF